MGKRALKSKPSAKGTLLQETWTPCNKKAPPKKKQQRNPSKRETPQKKGNHPPQKKRGHPSTKREPHQKQGPSQKKESLPKLDTKSKKGKALQNKGHHLKDGNGAHLLKNGNPSTKGAPPPHLKTWKPLKQRVTPLQNAKRGSNPPKAWLLAGTPPKKGPSKERGRWSPKEEQPRQNRGYPLNQKLTPQQKQTIRLPRKVQPRDFGREFCRLCRVSEAGPAKTPTAEPGDPGLGHEKSRVWSPRPLEPRHRNGVLDPLLVPKVYQKGLPPKYLDTIWV